MSFLPDNYEPPKTEGGNYFKLQDGKNTVRILSDVIVGWIYWSQENRPVRLRERPSQQPPDIRIGEDNKPDKIKHFWSGVVWTGDRIAVWEITQASIQQAIAALAEDPQWGHPRNYQITVTRSGKGLSTEYSVVPSPPSAIPSEVMGAWRAKEINLEELFVGGDPFDPPSAVMGAAGSATESRALRLLVDGLQRSKTLEQVSQWEKWALGKLEGIARYAGDEDRARQLVEHLCSNWRKDLSAAPTAEIDYESIPF